VTDANPLLKGYFYFKKSGKKKSRFVDIFNYTGKKIRTEGEPLNLKKMSKLLKELICGEFGFIFK
jgi:hypothetical protein